MHHLRSDLGPKRTYSARCEYERASWEDIASWFTSDREFRAFYRVPRAVFDDLVQRLQPKIQRNAQKQSNVSGVSFLRL